MSLNHINDLHERRIVGSILERLKASASGIDRVTVNTGDYEDDFIGDIDSPLLPAAIGVSDLSVLRVNYKDGARFMLQLVHGNGEDLIADYGGNDAGYNRCEALVAGL